MPVFLGIPVIIRFLVFIISSVFSYALSLLSVGFGRIALAISLFLGLIIGVNDLLVSILSSVSASLPENVSKRFGMILPSNALPCFYAIMSLKTAVFIFDVKNKLISYLDWKKI